MDNLITILQDKGLLTEDAAGRARSLLTEGKTLEEAIVAADGVSEEAMLKCLATTFEVPFVDLERSPPTKEFLSKFPARVLLRHHLLPLEERDDGVTVVATSRISDTAGIDELRLVCGREFALALAPHGEIDRCLKQILGVGADTIQTLDAATPGGLQVIDEAQIDDLDLTE